MTCIGTQYRIHIRVIICAAFRCKPLAAVIVRGGVSHQEAELHVVAAGIVLAIVTCGIFGVIIRVSLAGKKGNVGDVDSFSAGNTRIERDMGNSLITTAQIHHLIIET